MGKIRKQQNKEICVRDSTEVQENYSGSALDERLQIWIVSLIFMPVFTKAFLLKL